MFEQIVSNGVNTFLIIIACLFGFAGGLLYVDFLKTKKREKGQDHV